ncbi:uncharacterized protein V1516DRAFT_674221 [Lipomyces oligophaga]|uniref:uncharacterized protein n=1 Tax=Lipomyces oligophaga TaxID=45792 RepID=UPI0034CD8C13
MMLILSSPKDRLLFFYLISLVVLTGSTALTFAAIYTTHWLVLEIYPADRNGVPMTLSYGLHQQCSSVTGKCVPFPGQKQCADANDRELCTIWRTTAFMIWLSVVVLGPTLISYLTLLFESRQQREIAWKMISLLLTVISILQVVAVATMAWVPTNYRHLIGQQWKVGSSWGLAVGSAISVIVLLLSTLLIKFYTVPEYQPIPFYEELQRRHERRASMSSHSSRSHEW